MPESHVEVGVNEESSTENKIAMVLRSGKQLFNCLTNKNDDPPRTVDEILLRNDRHLWLDSMKSAYNSLMTKKTWKLADKPEEVPIVKNK